LRLKKEITLGDRGKLSLIAKASTCSMKQTFVDQAMPIMRGAISRQPYQPAGNGQPAQVVQSNFYSPVSTAGGFFGSGGPRAFQFAARLEF